MSTYPKGHTNLDLEFWIGIGATPGESSAFPDEPSHEEYLRRLLSKGADPSALFSSHSPRRDGSGALLSTAFDVLFMQAPPSSWESRLRLLLEAGLFPDTHTRSSDLVISTYTPSSPTISKIRSVWHERWLSSEMASGRILGLPVLLVFALVAEPASAVAALRVLMEAGVSLRDHHPFLPAFSVFWKGLTLHKVKMTVPAPSSLAMESWTEAALLLARAGACPDPVDMSHLVLPDHETLLARAMKEYLGHGLPSGVAPSSRTRL